MDGGKSKGKGRLKLPDMTKHGITFTVDFI